MNLPNSLVSQFAKLSKNQNESNEKTVYGTTVAQGDKLYVNIDGSDTITPVVSMSDIKPGERVSVLIKDHTATIIGNITNPSAGTEEVGKVLDEYDIIVAKIGNFELLVADKVTTEQLEASLAIIDAALIGKASIAELDAVKATIKDLDVSELAADIARIDKALIDKASIGELDAAYGEIDILKSDVADIETLIGGNLTMDNIQSLILTSSKVTVDNAFIKDAMIDRMSASKLTAGTINTSLITLESEDGSLNINGNLQQFKDANGNVRIQIGKDSNGDFTFVLYGEDGNGQILNQNGITASAISDGLIVNDMVASNANISGSKLDIDSVIETINDDGSKTIKGTKIYLDENKQTLDVAFNEMNTTVTNNASKIETQETSIATMQGSIETLISNTTIETDEGETVTLKDSFSSFKQTVDGMSGKISELETQGDNVTSKIAEFQTSLDGFSLTVSETTKEVTELGETLENTKTDFQQLVDSISLSVTKNGEDISALRLTMDGINLEGVVTFEDLEESGTTVINGNNITTGFISGDRIKGGTITATKEIQFQSGARIFGTEGESDAGLKISAAGFNLSGGSINYLGGSWYLSSGDLYLENGDLKLSSGCAIDGYDADLTKVTCTSLTASSTLKGPGTTELGSGYLYAPFGYGTRSYVKIGHLLMQADSTYGYVMTNASGSYVTVKMNRAEVLGDVTCNSVWASSKVYANNVALTSDERLKTDIRYVDYDIQNEGDSGLMSPNVNITTKDMHEFIEILPLASYRMKEEVASNIDYTYYGFIAQDILYSKVGSELVEYGEVQVKNIDYDDEGRELITFTTEERLRYSENKFIAFLAGALKEEICQRKALERKMDELYKIVGEISNL